jgi:NAD(P)-dependent dehydrogenase (short-subunit alcohol dehydrogenase family)
MEVEWYGQCEQIIAAINSTFGVLSRRAFWRLYCGHEIPAMLSSGGGAIVNNSSAAGHIGFPGSSVYVASKFAVIGLSKTAALEFARQGIRVNSVSPGPIQTEMFDRAFGEGETEMKKTIATQTLVGRVGTPEEIASAVLWLSSPGAAFITGQDVIVDGGYTAQ